MRRLLVLFVAVAVSSCSSAPAPDADGQAIYAQLCASCHSRDLSGGVGPPLGSGSNAAGLSDDVLAATIADGRGSRMPSFARTLSAEQIERLVAYLRERQSG